LDAYGDGVYWSDVSPMGPYTRDPHNPVSHKPTGFIPGAGHGSTFQDLNGQWWHIATGVISVRHNFERRIMLFPAYFDPDKFPAHFLHGNQMTAPSFLTDTLQGDFPTRLDQTKPGWQLLSLFKTVTVSSTLSDSYQASYAVDENIKTWWSARTGDAGEWLAVDLGSLVTAHAVQINFADQDAVEQGRSHDTYRYYVEISADGRSWSVLADLDRRENTRDSSQDYVELSTPVKLRHFRITSACIPGGARFSISGLRVFGFGAGKPPQAVSTVSVARNGQDRRKAEVSWGAAEGAQYYVVRWGLQGGPLFQNFQVYGGDTRVPMDALSIHEAYTFVVDSVNEAGLTRGVGTATAA